MANLQDSTINGDLNVTGVIQGGFYKPGDTIHSTFAGGGYVTSSGTRFTFSIPLPPLSPDVSGFELVDSTCTIRQGGKYILNEVNLLTGGHVECSYDIVSGRIVAYRDSAPTGVANNDGFGIMCTYDIRFI